MCMMRVLISFDETHTTHHTTTHHTTRAPAANAAHHHKTKATTNRTLTYPLQKNKRHPLYTHTTNPLNTLIFGGHSHRYLNAPIIITRTHTHTYAHARARARMHAHTYTHTHTLLTTLLHSNPTPRPPLSPQLPPPHPPLLVHHTKDGVTYTQISNMNM